MSFPRFEEVQIYWFARGAQLTEAPQLSDYIRKVILSDCLGCSIDQLKLDKTVAGKPFVSGPQNAIPVHFSITHTDHLWAMAVSGGRRVGIDIEELRGSDNSFLEDVADRYFSVEERKILRAIPPDERQKLFLRAWTRKEAFIKALGEEISYGLDRFGTGFLSSESEMLYSHNSEKSDSIWSLREIEEFRDNAVCHVALEYSGGYSVEIRKINECLLQKMF